MERTEENNATKDRFLCYSASISDKEKTVLCHFLSAPRLMKKVAERIFIAPL